MVLIGQSIARDKYMDDPPSSMPCRDRGGRRPRVRCRSVEVAERIRANGTNLTVAERRVAEAILAAPQAVGFGTVAELAAAADVGAASVVRLASKLGFDGYSELQACIQRDLTSQLRPAAPSSCRCSTNARNGAMPVPGPTMMTGAVGSAGNLKFLLVST